MLHEKKPWPYCSRSPNYSGQLQTFSFPLWPLLAEKGGWRTCCKILFDCTSPRVRVTVSLYLYRTTDWCSAGWWWTCGRIIPVTTDVVGIAAAIITTAVDLCDFCKYWTDVWGDFRYNLSKVVSRPTRVVTRSTSRNTSVG